MSPIRLSLSPYFSVLYGGVPITETELAAGYPEASDIFNGVRNLPLNEEVSIRFDGSFTMTRELPRLLIGVLSGSAQSVDFTIVNITRGREEARIMGVSPGHVQEFEFEFEDAFDNQDHFDVIAIAREGYGDTNLLVQWIR